MCIPSSLLCTRVPRTTWRWKLPGPKPKRPHSAWAAMAAIARRVLCEGAPLGNSSSPTPVLALSACVERPRRLATPNAHGRQQQSSSCSSGSLQAASQPDHVRGLHPPPSPHERVHVHDQPPPGVRYPSRACAHGPGH
eukprot:CAMPEP_0181182472 /NCGR_PEP_ID=MMETSP1096-20121128/7910_1 /TAXON_ID=156174 ORGANISM="Chrysochromulina ericina, Strain CCMP281" /NCGR_SAMPLE_ID=MMETSP1096 /ASSEMBLY_ACC=CAM_ASM_000453 /LENGTH=137 /DNA_ID=CAMNT_0023271087 /DNA_START=565 /DNA_END=979 /DNA_ORIENTATION=-